MMIVADKEVSLVLTGTGDVLEPETGVMAIGSGGNYALAAARALIDSDKDAETIVRRGLDIAADICVYTNRNRHDRDPLGSTAGHVVALRLPPNDISRSAAGQRGWANRMWCNGGRSGGAVCARAWRSG